MIPSCSDNMILGGNKAGPFKGFGWSQGAFIAYIPKAEWMSWSFQTANQSRSREGIDRTSFRHQDPPVSLSLIHVIVLSRCLFSAALRQRPSRGPGYAGQVRRDVFFEP
jgi:hypothetical protein